ncbi:hypothetical protein CcI49_03155 [Frankia sp. CcI49]|uniref:hypothetical protein n=1 Tax=Frankia sp. CcI49 TaxID=1745382 RepID=UPI0009768A49|nr:hypothetical protein [Frankia sp. CcI49]ONH62391.1 hypothetical protein CcI49_03155 [Frankia sp. CcI49]
MTDPIGDIVTRPGDWSQASTPSTTPLRRREFVISVPDIPEFERVLDTPLHVVETLEFASGMYGSVLARPADDAGGEWTASKWATS